MKTSQDGIDLIQHFEDCELEAYPDPKTGGDPWTIGWGHCGPEVGPGLVWTPEQANDQFAIDLEVREKELFHKTTRTFTQGQFDALLSFLYNVGPGRYGIKDGLFELKGGGSSTLWRLFRTGDDAGAADQFLRWVNPGSSVERGLRRRRVAERALFLGLDWRTKLNEHIAGGG